MGYTNLVKSKSREDTRLSPRVEWPNLQLSPLLQYPSSCAEEKIKLFARRKRTVKLDLNSEFL